MQISYTSEGNVQLKTKTETVNIGNGLKIGQREITGPGEYDIASIQCEGQPTDHATAYFIRAEDLWVTFLTDVDPSATKLDDISETAILILDVRSDTSADKIKTVVKAIEPAYLFLIGAGSKEPAVTGSLGIPASPDHSLKVVSTGLPLEGTTLIAAA